MGQGWKLRLFTFSLGVLVAYVWHLDFSVPEEFYFRTGDFIRKFGYLHKEHQVLTDDGCVLTIFRVASPERRLSSVRPVPVLLAAGLFGSSDVMVMTGPEKDIPFILADEGFDVWLGNYRGNRYSVPGPTANFTDPKINDFGFEEIGVLDFAAQIDFILNETGSTHLDMVVVSAGSSSLIALQSLRPEYNAKIRKALHFGSGMVLMLDNPYQIGWFYLCWRAAWLVKVSNALEYFPFKAKVMIVACERSFLAGFCRNLVSQAIGYPEDFDNPRLSALLLTLLPSGTPLGVVDHIMQITNEATALRRRDWGIQENLEKYNASEPPAYNVTGITTSSKSYNTKGEGLITYDLPRQVFSQMPNFVGEFMVEAPFEHINFFINSARNRAFVEDVIAHLSN